MAIFRDGVKVGKHDIRTGLSKERAQGILRTIDILPDDKGRKKFEKDAMGDVQTIRTIVGMGEGFTMPVNFKCSFYQMDMGIDQEVLSTGGPPPSGPPTKSGTNNSQVKYGSLDWKTHIMQNSTKNLFLERYKQANAAAQGIYQDNNPRYKGLKRDEQKMNLYCSKVTIPEKQITTSLVRTYGSPHPWPQAIQYGTITTTFYCDATMHIKNYFDAWQKLIYNDLTGNLNFYNEYTSEFDVHTRTTMASGGQTGKIEAEDEGSWAKDISDGIKDVTKAINDVTGVDNPRDKAQAAVSIPKVDFRDNYGVKIFECFPQIVGGIDLAHDATDAIATFDVTWSYKKWNPFKMGNLGNRSQVNLAIGEFRNEKDGFPFLEDLPPELSGPLTGAVNQGINTGPLSKASNLFG